MSPNCKVRNSITIKISHTFNANSKFIHITKITSKTTLGI
jgi:hypothetical protein